LEWNELAARLDRGVLVAEDRRDFLDALREGWKPLTRLDAPQASSRASVVSGSGHAGSVTFSESAKAVDS
jgi:hypothetical protein